MNNQGKLLSICIPNYNQGLALQLNIRNLISIIDDPQVEVLISDNGSTDSHSAQALEIAERELDGVRIFRGAASYLHGNRIQQGLGANINRLVENASGDYVWIIGSGDLIRCAYFKDILKILSEKNLDNLVLKALTYKDLDSPLLIKWNEDLPEQGENYRFKVEDNYPFFDHAISCNITRRSIMLAKKDSFKFQDIWPHVEKYITFFSEASNIKSFNVNPEIVLIDQPGEGWYTHPRAVEIYLELGELYANYVNKNKLNYDTFKSELFRNRILSVVGLVIHLRLSSEAKRDAFDHRASMIAADLPIFRRIYFLTAVNSPLRTLKIIRAINSFLKRISRA
jgi:glycosyltransferase involved in cell wall biosynthesis